MPAPINNAMILQSTRLFFLLTLLIPHLLFAGETPKQTTGPSEFSAKILGGSESKDGQWPWMAALLQSIEPDTYQAQYCSGVLIAPTWVLTAAHCVEGKNTGDIEVAVGVFDLKTFAGPRIKTQSIYIHPGYDTFQLSNDIALIELQQSSAQPPITLFSGESQDTVPANLLGITLTALGWGWADLPSWPPYPEKLRQVDLPVVEESICNNIYHVSLLSSQICAGYYEGKDVCGGDSGGPVVTRIDGEWVHAGLVSYGKPCDIYNGWYGVYTRTSEFVNFIQSHVPGARFTGKAVALPWLLLLTKP